MIGRPQLIAACAGAVIVVGLLWSATSRIYAAPRAALEAEIEQVAASVEKYRAQLDDDRWVQQTLRATADRTLGADLETVDHRLRTRLNRIAESIALAGVTVGTGDVSARRSPARTAFPRGGAWKTLRESVDFVEIEGWVTGEGDLGKIVELVDRIDAEPWVKRISQVRIDPKDNGARFAVTVRLATLFLPGSAPEHVESPAYDRSRLDRFAMLVGANPFRLPEAAPTRVADVSAPKAGLPRREWMLTGVAEGPGGAEAWLRNVASGATRQIVIGESIDQAKLVGAATDWAEFELEEERFRVRVGTHLQDRQVIR